MKYMSICTTANGPSGADGVCVNGLWGCLSYFRVRQVSQFFIIFVIMSLFKWLYVSSIPLWLVFKWYFEFRFPDHEDS